MNPRYENGNVVARCPQCEAVTTFEFRSQSNEFGSVIINRPHEFEGISYPRTIYKLLRCAGCHRGGLAEIHCANNVTEGALGEFYPFTVDAFPIPSSVPESIQKEFREAELCVSIGANRSASALFRSVLEKALQSNGYTERRLVDKIDAAAEDGVITEARKERAHEDIRVLGNDVLHDEWREVSVEEVQEAHRYSQRILEDFYDDRETVVKMLTSENRLTVESADEET